jgi:hypothetical protein
MLNWGRPPKPIRTLRRRSLVHPRHPLLCDCAAAFSEVRSPRFAKARCAAAPAPGIKSPRLATASNALQAAPREEWLSNGQSDPCCGQAVRWTQLRRHLSASCHQARTDFLLPEPACPACLPALPNACVWAVPHAHAPSPCSACRRRHLPCGAITMRQVASGACDALARRSCCLPCPACPACLP